MTDKDKILKKIHDEKEGLMDAQGNFGYPEHEGAFHVLCNLEAYIDSLPKEQVSEDLNKEYHNFLKREWFDKPGKTISEMMRLTAEYFANWQKEQMMKDAVDAEVGYGKGFVIPLLGCILDEFGLDYGDKVKLIIVK